MAGRTSRCRCTDDDLRQLLTKPLCHVRFPFDVSSLSIDDGVFTCGYSLYRDLTLRDAHMDVALRWQAAYLSPNEGGSGASAPLFLDFCTACLGRDALAVFAAQEPYEDPEPIGRLRRSKLPENSLPSKTR